MADLLPPGTLFYPSEEELVNYYLINKNQNPVADDGANHGFTFIRELNLYEHSPYNLPPDTCYSYGEGGSKRHWYCYTARVVEEGETRRAVGGFWKGRGILKSVMNHAGAAVVGTRRTFWFYAGNSSDTAVETDWVMYEYSLLDRFMAAFVVCRLFTKPVDSSLGSSGSPGSIVYNFYGPSFFENPNLVLNQQHFWNGNHHNMIGGGIQLNGNGAPDVVEASFSSENLADTQDEDASVDSEKRNNETDNRASADAAPVSTSKIRAQIALHIRKSQPKDDRIRVEPRTVKQHFGSYRRGRFYAAGAMILRSVKEL